MLKTWHDTARDRDVPVKIYFPGQADAQEPLTANQRPDATAAGQHSAVGSYPLILFSHGLGGTRDGYAYLGRFWASHGFIVVHVQHIGSDDAVWRGNPRPFEAMKKAVGDRDNAINRPLDISFAIDQMIKANVDKASPFFGKVDTNAIGAAGHSFGAYTVLAIAGQGNDRHIPGLAALEDDRVKAIIAMSAPVNEKRAQMAQLYAPITIPALHITGTRDNSPIGSTSADQRRIPFDQMHLADDYLLTLKGADHMVFSGTRTRGKGDPDLSKNELAKQDANQHALIKQSSLAFWRAYLLQDTVSKYCLLSRICG